MGWNMPNILVNLASKGGGMDPAVLDEIAEIEQNVDELQALMQYESDPVAIGKIGNDTLYRKIISLTNTTINGATTIDLHLPSGFKIFNYSGCIFSSSSYRPLSYYATGSINCAPSINTSGVMSFLISGSHTSANVNIIVEYTVPAATKKSKKVG